MKFKFECPYCGQHIAATPPDIGMEARCPNCSRTIAVPDPAAGSAMHVESTPAKYKMNENTITHAGFWRRFAAYFLDTLILNFVMNNVYWFFIHQLEMAIKLRQTGSNYGGRGMDSAYELANKWGYYALMPFGIMAAWVYFAGMESSPLQATVGKLACGIKVTGETGGRASFAQVTGRHFGKILSSLILGIGFIMAATSRTKQALHDSMAGTYVIDRE